MTDPEFAHVFFRACEAHAVVHHGVSEERRVVIKPDLVLFCPVDPAAKRRNIVSVAVGVRVLGVYRVQIQFVLRRRKRVNFFDIRAKFRRVSRRVRIVAGNHVFGLRGLFLEPANVVALPAMQRDLDFGELFQRFVDVYAERRVAFFREFVILNYVLFVHLLLLYRVFV